MIFLERDEIAALVDMRLAAPAIEAAYQASTANEIELPPVGHITFPDHNADCHIKFGHHRSQPTFVIKVATGFPNNDPARAPTGNGVSIVMSAETGETLAILYDQMLLTDVRTAVGSAIATRLLARPDACKLLVVGTGAQAGQQIKAHRELLDRELDISIWGRSPEKASGMAAKHDADVATDLEAACRNADIIVSVTGARSPIIASDWIQPGTHITAVGADAPGKHELAFELLNRADHLAADSIEQCLDHGEFSMLDTSRHGDVVELGTLITSPPVRSDDQLSIADLTGTAAQDIAIANCILTAHAEQGS